MHVEYAQSRQCECSPRRKFYNFDVALLRNARVKQIWVRIPRQIHRPCKNSQLFTLKGSFPKRHHAAQVPPKSICKEFAQIFSKS